MSQSERNVMALYPYASARRNYLEGGYYVQCTSYGRFIGEGETEQDAWDDAARKMLAKELEA